ncbi:unnamed protein product [Sphagnum tenellum]
MADAAIMGVEKLERARWAGMVASSWVQAALGVLYCFGLYAPMLKQVLDYNQAQLNILGFAKDFGAYVGIVAGLAINTIRVWGFLALGSMQSLVGYGVLWLVLSGRIAPPPYWLVCMLLAVGSNSITWLDTGNIVTNVKNFPHRRGAVTGILKCCFGLSSAIFTLLYVAIFNNNSPASVLLLSALLTTAACLLGLPFIQLLTPAKLQEDSLRNKSSFIWFYVILIAFTLYLLAAALLTSTGFTNSLATQVMACGILLFLGAPLFLPSLISQFGHSNSSVVVRDQPFLLPCQHEGDLRVHDFLETQNSSDAPAMKTMAAGDDDEVAVMKVLEEEETAGEETIVMQQLHGGDHDDESEYSLMRAVRKLDFWLLFFSFLIGAGTAVTAQNNLGQLGEAQSLTNVTVYVSLIGTMSSLG